MRRFKMPFITVLIIAVMALTLFTPIPNIVKIVLIALALVGLVWASWGNHLFAKAAKIIRAKDPSRMNEAIELLERSIKAGMGDQNMVVAGALVVQYGHAEIGKEALEELLGSKQKDVRCNARVSLSMYWWAKKDLDKAIELVEKARDEGWKNTNFFINSATYYLEKGDEKNFKRTISDARKANSYSVPLMDLEAANELMKGNWKGAGILLNKLFEIQEPVFLDPYVHMAIVYLNYGELKLASDVLDKALKTQFSNTSIVKEETIREWTKLFKDENTRLDIADALRTGIEAIVKREELKIEKTGRKCSLDKLEGFEEMPSFKVNDEELPEEMRGYDSDEDEREDANQDLTDEDEEWLRKHPGN